MRSCFFLLATCAMAISTAYGDSLNCRLVGYCATPDRAWNVAVVGNHAYVADDSAGLRIVSVADPAYPVEVGFYNTIGYARGVAVVGDYAYVADWDAGLGIISVTDPAHPVEVSHYLTPSRHPYDVAVVGHYAYVADSDSGLRVISVFDPANPSEVAHCNTPDIAHDVAVVGNYAYVADWDAGLRVISVADPWNPVEVGHCNVSGWAMGVAVVGNYAYVADGYALRIVSVADPANPVEAGFYDTPGEAWGVAVVGNYAYVADGDAGLQICQFYGGMGIHEGDEPQASSLTPRATIVRGELYLLDRNDLPVAKRLGWETAPKLLLDISGHEVMELHLGSNDVSRLGAGIYFLRESGFGDRGRGGVRKVVIAR